MNEPPGGEQDLSPLYYSYGRAMAKWATIEWGLGNWFGFLTGMSYDMGNKIFFSAKSFNGRSALVEAAIPHSAMADDVKAFVKAAVNKAVIYSTFRNTLAHGIPTFTIDRSGSRPVLSQGHYNADETFALGVPLDQIDTAAVNFGRLGGILFESGAHLAPYAVKFDGRPTPQELLERVESLPNQAERATLSQKQLGRQRQRRS